MEKKVETNNLILIAGDEEILKKALDDFSSNTLAVSIKLCLLDSLL